MGTGVQTDCPGEKMASHRTKSIRICSTICQTNVSMASKQVQNELARFRNKVLKSSLALTFFTEPFEHAVKLSR